MTGGFLVTGPGCEGRGAPSRGSATSLAITLAGRLDRPGACYVRENDSIVVRVEKHDDRRVTVTTVRKEQA